MPLTPGKNNTSNHPIIFSRLDSRILFANSFSFPHPVKSQVVRQGSIGVLYQEAGGKVCYFGKPYPLIFEYIQKWAVKHLGLEAWKDVIIIGDNCETDICGGNQAGIDTALITDTGLANEPILTLGIEGFLASLPMENRPKFLVSSFSTGVYPHFSQTLRKMG